MKYLDYLLSRLQRMHQNLNLSNAKISKFSGKMLTELSLFLEK